MDKFLNRLAALISVKSIVTICLTGTFCYLVTNRLSRKTSPPSTQSLSRSILVFSLKHPKSMTSKMRYQPLRRTGQNEPNS